MLIYAASKIFIFFYFVFQLKYFFLFVSFDTSTSFHMFHNVLENLVYSANWGINPPPQKHHSPLSYQAFVPP